MIEVFDQQCENWIKLIDLEGNSMRRKRKTGGRVATKRKTPARKIRGASFAKGGIFESLPKSAQTKVKEVAKLTKHNDLDAFCKTILVKNINVDHALLT